MAGKSTGTVGTRPAEATMWSVWLACVAVVAIVVIAVVVTGRSQVPPRPVATPQPAAAPPVPVSPIAPAEPEPQHEVAQTSAPALQGEPYIVPAGRSPLLSPGETLDAPIPATRLVKESTPVPVPEGEIVPWHQAHRYVGRTITVEGKIVDTHDTGSVCFLNFADHRKSSFYIIIFSDALGQFPDRAEKYFLNKTIRATGEVHTHGDRAQIRVNNPNQLSVVDD